MFSSASNSTDGDTSANWGWSFSLKYEDESIKLLVLKQEGTLHVLDSM
jgi:hypothetical protein